MRVKTGIIRRKSHKKVLQRTKGFRLSKGRLFKASNEADMHALRYAFVGRKLKKRNLRTLWIQRINAGLLTLDTPLKYSKLINLLKVKNIKLDRKILAELAVNDLKTFQSIVTFTTS